MAAFGGLAAAHGLTLEEAVAGTLWDWARQKGYTPEELNRAIQAQGVGPGVNEFADDMMRRPVAASQPLTDQLTAKFKPVTPEEFIAERDKSEKRPFLTPYTADDMRGWQHFLTEDGAGFALTPEKDIVGVFNNSGPRGAGKDAVILAIAKGGKTLDCIAGILDAYYNEFGFIEKGRVPWDDALAPKGWDYEEYGPNIQQKGPDIVFFEFPEDFSRNPADTRRRVEIARGEGGPRWTRELWDHDRWVEEINKDIRERMDNPEQETPRQGTGDYSAGLEQAPKPSEKHPKNKGHTQE